ncbi:hypothetical protein L1987_27518 [Smallanthus sonchifolius]|uniref:Uncharacterized protein n=1 Tax=Smallanthus sonchifolius TaxID=185202 RepID=A0ACB9ICS6_9ASTR|nr:hypothetical protein L1987_27518 [Smallanthus sonchifolius]
MWTKDNEFIGSSHEKLFKYREMCDSPKYLKAIIRFVQELFPESQVVPDTPLESQPQSSVRSFRIGSVAKQQRQQMKITCSTVMASQNAKDDALKNTEVVARDNPQVTIPRRLFK